MGEPSKPDLGIYYDMLRGLPKEPSLSFLSKDWPDVDAWRKEAREKTIDLMNFSPRNVPLNSSIDSSKLQGDLVIEEISYDLPYGPRAQGFFLYPKDREKLPAVVALHDHGGFFYFGKEKIADSGIVNSLLYKHKEQCYGGRSWANELAKRGFAVLVVDSFMWGSRRIPIDSINEELVAPLEGLEPGSEDFIQAYNIFWDAIESSITFSTVLAAGATWPGILFYEDRRSIDYLLTRPEIDSDRIACGGLSGGGLRTVFLAGLDPRIRAAFCVGWMSTTGGMLRNHIHGHGLAMCVPNLLNLLDIPDVVSLRAPSPLMVQYDIDDRLFSLEGQKEADRKLSETYAHMGHSENYIGKFYPGRHKFDIAMQQPIIRTS